MSIEITQPVVGDDRDETIVRQFREDIQTEAFTHRIKSLKPGAKYDVVVKLDHSDHHAGTRITAPDGWTLENVFMASSGTVMLRVNKDN